MGTGQPGPARCLALAAGMALLIAGCAGSLPLQGETDKEIFSGSATGYLDQSGTLAIRSNKGTTCTGTFAYTSPVYGNVVEIIPDQRGIPDIISCCEKDTAPDPCTYHIIHQVPPVIHCVDSLDK